MSMNINMEKVSKGVIALAIALIMISILLPIGLNEFLDPATWTNSTGSSIWDIATNGDTLETLVTVLLPILAILGLVMFFMPRFRGSE